jgi:1,4-alpha-glucan branching enzyme
MFTDFLTIAQFLAHRAAGTADNDSLYFTDQDHAGPVWAIWKSEVRQFLIDNAVFFLQEYHVDGFRYDQASVIVQTRANDGWRFCQDPTNTTRYIKPSAINIAEYWNADPDVVRSPEHGGAGFDACWHDGLRHSLRARSPLPQQADRRTSIWGRSHAIFGR